MNVSVKGEIALDKLRQMGLAEAEEALSGTLDALTQALALLIKGNQQMDIATRLAWRNMVDRFVVEQTAPPNDASDGGVQ